jgi:hypothetical protein
MDMIIHNDVTFGRSLTSLLVLVLRGAGAERGSRASILKAATVFRKASPQIFCCCMLTMFISIVFGFTLAWSSCARIGRVCGVWSVPQVWSDNHKNCSRCCSSTLYKSHMLILEHITLSCIQLCTDVCHRVWSPP